MMKRFAKEGRESLSAGREARSGIAGLGDCDGRASRLSLGCLEKTAGKRRRRRRRKKMGSRETGLREGWEWIIQVDAVYCSFHTTALKASPDLVKRDNKYI